jgi:hypothetical protein
MSELSCSALISNFCLMAVDYFRCTCYLTSSLKGAHFLLTFVKVFNLDVSLFPVSPKIKIRNIERGSERKKPFTGGCMYIFLKITGTNH